MDPSSTITIADLHNKVFFMHSDRSSYRAFTDNFTDIKIGGSVHQLVNGQSNDGWNLILVN